MIAFLSLRFRAFTLMALNLAGLWYFWFQANPTGYGAYVGVGLVHYGLVRTLAKKTSAVAWLAILFPIGVLIALKYVLPNVPAGMAPVGIAWVGISYFAFRLAHLTLQVRNGVVEPPSPSEYLAYAFFLPTMLVGPISPYDLFLSSLRAPDRNVTPVFRCLLRIVVGAAKYMFLGHLCERIAYRGLLLDGHPHGLFDLSVAAVAYYLHIYLNFSGFCDVAIGVAGLLGIQIAENFDAPFKSRNVKELWNRWHITLSVFMRDILFAPLSKFLVTKLGPSRADHAIALTITVVFVLVGIWHGVGLHFAIFGGLHALGVVANHYFTIALKRRLGKEGFRAYNASPWIRRAAVGATFAYVAFTFFFFANDGEQMRKIMDALTMPRAG